MVKKEFLGPWRRARLPKRSREEASHPTLPRVTLRSQKARVGREVISLGGLCPLGLESCGPFPGQHLAGSQACDQGTHLSLHMHSRMKMQPSLLK